MSLKVLTWQEALPAALWLAVAAGLLWLDLQLPNEASAALWVLLAVGLLIMLRRFWSWLLGPLFVYDLVRTARRNRLIPPRCFLALAMLAVLFLFYASWYNLRMKSWDELFSPRSVRLDSLAAFGSSMFSFFFGMQYLAVFLLTPLYTAGAIAEEKERRTLDLLLTTQMTNREIVFGLLASRLTTLGLIFLTTLPMLSLLEFLGGVDPQIVLVGFLIIAVVMVAIGCMCMLVSVNSKTTTWAFGQGYLYGLVLGGCWSLAPVLAFQTLGNPTAIWAMAGLFAVMGLALSAVVLIRAVFRLRAGTQGGIPWPVPHGGYHYGGEIPFFGTLVDFRENYPRHEPVWEASRPQVTDSCVFWKEFSFRPIPVQLAVYSIFFWVYFFVGCVIALWSSDPRESNRNIQRVGPIAVAFLVFPVGILSSRMIAKEREGRTLDSLLTTQVEPKQILRQKWQACIYRIRWLFVAIGGVYFLTLTTGGVHWSAFLALIASTIVYTAFVASLGLLISTFCRTCLKAMLIYTVAFIAIVGIGQTIKTYRIILTPADFSWRADNVLLYAMSPQGALQGLAFNERDLINFPWDIAAAFLAVGLVALATWGLWKLTVYCFERSTGGRPSKRLRPPPVPNG